MPRESQAAREERAKKILERLRQTYPGARCELNFKTPLELLIATILSAQCNDKQVNIVTADLFQKYRTAADFAHAHLPDLENDLRRLGLFRNKAKNIQACARQLVERFGGNVPATMEELVSLEGVGRKTANVVLGNVFNRNEGVVVDTHVARLAQRFGITKESKPEKIEADMMKLVPQKDWTLFSHWLIWHGRRRCFARGPQCGACEIRELCPSRDLAA